MPTRIPCPNCEGIGSVELPVHLQETFDEVKRGRDTAVKVRAALIGKGRSSRITINAYLNRLAELRSLGLIDSQRDGRHLRYTPVKK